MACSGFSFYSVSCGPILPPNVSREVVLEHVTADLPQLFLVGLVPVTGRGYDRIDVHKYLGRLLVILPAYFR